MSNPLKTGTPPCPPAEQRARKHAKRHAHYRISFNLRLPLNHRLACTGDLKDYIEEKLDELKWVTTGELSHIEVDDDHEKNLAEEFSALGGQ